MIRKQIIALAAVLALLVIFAVLYFALIKPAVDEAGAVAEETPETLEGEEIGTAGRFYMYSHLERADMASIEVTNGTGTYRLVRDGNDTFYIDGFEGIALDDSMVSSLVVTCGSPLSKTRVAADASDEKLKEYGLKDPVAHWVVTDNEGKKYKVYVGRALLTGGGYYCAFAGRNSVYVLDTSLADTVLKPAEAFVTPYIMFGVSQDDYYTVEDFTVYHGTEKFLSVGKVPQDRQNNPEALAESVLSYPAPYVPESEVYYRILMSFISLTGDETYRLGATEKDLAECGLDNPDHTMAFVYGGHKYYIFASDAGDGNYYVLSSVYGDIITKTAKKNMAYLEYDLYSWLSPYVFRRNITTIKSVSVKTKDIDETFRLNHSVTEGGSAAIQVATDSGRTYLSENETLNFRHYYSNFLALALVDYLPEEASPGVPMDDFLADEDNLTMKITVETLSGDVYVYDIYRYSTRRCAISVNGRFDFCMLNDVVRRIESDTLLILNGETVVGTY